MKIPKKIDILGQHWKVAIEKIEDDLDGLCESDKRKITIHKGVHKEARGETLLHELCHAIFLTVGLNEFFRSPQEEEDFVLRFSPTLYAVLAQNGLNFKRDDE